ncbi:hypothetical protein Pla110_40220 [Polystyrenella longa]|uniref:Uncharacterized protein n=1 Tax=Polystyrenella longa TaxID=2528007 RepID=A0A518CSR0_9PLAN|nr:hypothetical protein Pla110_40220 [Polystyrenella longa]
MRKLRPLEVKTGKPRDVFLQRRSFPSKRLPKEFPFHGSLCIVGKQAINTVNPVGETNPNPRIGTRVAIKTIIKQSKTTLSSSEELFINQFLSEKPRHCTRRGFSVRGGVQHLFPANNPQNSFYI